jgi:hypothetical protein
MCSRIFWFTHCMHFSTASSPISGFGSTNPSSVNFRLGHGTGHGLSSTASAFASSVYSPSPPNPAGGLVVSRPHFTILCACVVSSSSSSSTECNKLCMHALHACTACVRCMRALHACAACVRCMRALHACAACVRCMRRCVLIFVFIMASSEHGCGGAGFGHRFLHLFVVVRPVG